ncbi:MAG: FGGY-family carbohydrate kinase, partial [Lachnospiraceae bacterium]|nr:FGGY-family carbohydrate kinase [Lachnospiraceae bacterium]
ITDIIKAMEKDSGSKIKELCVDGGPTGNNYLMQFQSDMADAAIHISEAEEMSGLGAAYAAGLGMGFFDRKTLFQGEDRKTYLPEMSHEDVAKKYDGWKKAVERALIKN